MIVAEVLDSLVILVLLVGHKRPQLPGLGSCVPEPVIAPRRNWQIFASKLRARHEGSRELFETHVVEVMRVGFGPDTRANSLDWKTCCLTCHERGMPICRTSPYSKHGIQHHTMRIFSAGKSFDGAIWAIYSELSQLQPLLGFSLNLTPCSLFVKILLRTTEHWTFLESWIRYAAPQFLSASVCMGCVGSQKKGI